MMHAGRRQTPRRDVARHASGVRSDRQAVACARRGSDTTEVERVCHCSTSRVVTPTPTVGRVGRTEGD
jgi:hypothetical protein